MRTLPPLSCLLALFGCCLCFADEVRLPDPLKSGNDVYKGTLYVKHDAAYVTFMHESGTACVLFSSLPKEVQRLLDYDPQAAEAQLEEDREKQQGGAAQAATSPTMTPTVTIHGRLVANTEKGLFVAVVRETGRTKNVQQWSGGAVTKNESSESSSTSVSSDSTRIASSDEPIYETVYYLVTGNRNAEYLKPGIAVDYVIVPRGADGYEGREATMATFVKSLR